MPPLVPLPVDDHVPRVREALGRRRAVVLSAAPGAGKTTRVPPALVADGPVLLLEPRRVAARAIARRIADERGWTVGREVGWQVRFERRFSEATRLLVATEGVLTARLQQDPLASDFRTIVLDEFHERSLHADLGLALSRQAWLARSDLRLVVMSATIDTAQVAAFLGDCEVIDVPGRLHPVDVAYRPGVAVERAVADLWPATGGSVLVFLPGAAEIRRAQAALVPILASARVLPLYGSLSAEEQDRALVPSGERRVIVATNLAETSLTVPDVTAVVDVGLQKVARYDATRAIDSLEVERISEDAAAQRTGRAGRLAAGRAIRLWDSRDRLRPHREAEVARIDLAGACLDLVAWGADPDRFEWFERPPVGALAGARTLLRRLGALTDAGTLTDIGRLLQRMPVAPRLGRILVAARGAPVAARACAFLSERGATVPRHEAGDCDLLAAVDRAADLPPQVLTVARELETLARTALGSEAVGRLSDTDFRRAVLAGYPDRVARRRQPHAPSLLLASGSGARLARESGVVDAEWLVAVEMRGQVGEAAEPLVRVATAIDRAWLEPTGTEVIHAFDEDRGRVRAEAVDRYGALVLAARHVAPDPDLAGPLLAEAFLGRALAESDAQLVRRLAFIGEPVDLPALVAAASAGRVRLAEVALDQALAAPVARRLAREAPVSLTLPDGSAVRVDYREGGRPVVAVKLQRVIGLTETPRLGPRRAPVTFELLAPNSRPVQVTADLASFWSTVYPTIRGPLRARYPKHRWP